MSVNFNLPSPLLPACILGTLLAGCASLPTEGPALAARKQIVAQDEGARAAARFPLYERPTDRLFGIRLEQGALDVEPDVESMVAYQQQRLLERAQHKKALKAAPQWEDLGPGNNLGRIVDIAFNPQDSKVMYIASPGGGVYKSTDGGANWYWLAALPYQAVNSIAIDPANPDVVYFGTGHYDASGDALLSMGIYKSTDGGSSFALLPATVPTTDNQSWLRVLRVLTHPTVANLVFAGTTAGFFRSTDGGATWSQVSTLSTYDIAIDPNNPSNMLRGRVDGAISYSTNAGAGWTTVPIVSGASGSVRVRVKYAKSVAGLVYASVDQNKGELYRSADGGLTWELISTPEHNQTQGFHTNQLWVSPTDANHVIVGGIELFRSVDAGATFTKISDWAANSSQASAGNVPNTPHSDQNVLASPPNYSEANPVFYAGTDGGLFVAANARTVAQQSGWTKHPGSFYISQVVGAAGRRLNGTDTIVIGMQDNGSHIKTGNDGWVRRGSGDGGVPAIDPAADLFFGQNPTALVFRASSQNFARAICNGITEADPASCGSSNVAKTNFYAPMEIDPNNPNRLYVGANSLWLSGNAKATTPTWAAIKAPVTGRTNGTSSSNYISAISIQRGDSNQALVGHNDGQVFRTGNLLSGAPAWTALSAGLPSGRMVGAVLIDPEDGNRLYVGFAGYFADNFWRSDDAGATWRNLSTGLPPGTIYAITRHPLNKDKVFVGTIWGSYGSDNGGLTWPVANDGPYPTQIRKLFWLGGDTLYAATYGSSMTRAKVYAYPASTVVEYYHNVLDNFFITADPAEQAAVDSGAAGAEWQRTGNTFKAGGNNLVCRFYGNARTNPATGRGYGPNSHFYTADAAECGGLKAAYNPNAKSWFFESNDFRTTAAVNGTCAAGLVPVYRAYNNGFARGVDSNHRIVTGQAGIDEVLARGWKNEGVVMCAPS